VAILISLRMLSLSVRDVDCVSRRVSNPFHKFSAGAAALLSAPANGIVAPGNGCYSAGVSLKLDIPTDVPMPCGLPPAEARVKCSRNWRWRCTRAARSLRQGRALAGLLTWDFDQLLGERRVNRPYGRTNLIWI